MRCLMRLLCPYKMPFPDCDICMPLRIARWVALSLLLVNSSINIYELHVHKPQGVLLAAHCVRLFVLWLCVGVVATSIAKAVHVMENRNGCKPIKG